MLPPNVAPALPAHLTKHLSVLRYPIADTIIHLSQLDDGQSNGTALWLGAQCLSAFLAHNIPANSRPRVLELGSGIGLTALTLAALGWDVLATDHNKVLSTVLRRNIDANSASLPAHSGTIEIRELDWTILPEKWTWDSSTAISTSLPATENTQQPGLSSDQRSKSTLVPPFDLIVSADTVYSLELVQPLLRTLHALCTASIQFNPLTAQSRSPPVYLCIERRDPTLVDIALTEAQNMWGFSISRIPHRKISKSMEKHGLKWAREDWDGVEIWKLTMGVR